jgi:nitrite reductase/ring-hydroxylating ferredoxin subunit
MKLVGRVPLKALENRAMVRLRYPPYHVLVTLVEGEPCAIEDACNHAGASLSKGERDATCVTCPLHEYVFDLRTGVLVMPEGFCSDQRTFHAVVEGDEVVVYDPFELKIF